MSSYLNNPDLQSLLHTEAKSINGRKSITQWDKVTKFYHKFKIVIDFISIKLQFVKGIQTQ